MNNRRGHFIPSNAAQFNLYMRNIFNFVAEKLDSTPPKWTHIPSGRFQTLEQKYVRFFDAFQTALETPTHGNVLARQEAQAAAASELRAFIAQFLRFPPVTNPDRADMGIPNHDTIRTDHTIVRETVDFVIHLRNIRELMIDFWIQGSDNKAKPEGYDGAVIIWDVLDAPPEHPDDLNRHTMASRTPFPLHFDEAERGKTVYVSLCWQNERGITGAWSEIKSAVIP